MHESFERIDGKLIDHVFQPLADCVAARTPLDCFRMARLLTDLSALAWVLSQLQVMTIAVASGIPGFVACESLLVVVGLGSLMVIRALFQRAGGQGQHGHANPLRPRMYAHRFGCLLWMVALGLKLATEPGGFAALALVVMALCGTMAVYVGACSNPPPARREQHPTRWLTPQPT